jgi:hypothetical protein
MRIVDLHTDLIGKICMITEVGVALEKEYEKMYGIGNYYAAQQLFHFNYHSKYKYVLMFIDEKPFTKFNETWFCVKEVGEHSNGDMHWYTLNQLIICEQ